MQNRVTKIPGLISLGVFSAIIATLILDLIGRLVAAALGFQYQSGLGLFGHWNGTFSVIKTIFAILFWIIPLTSIAEILFFFTFPKQRDRASIIIFMFCVAHIWFMLFVVYLVVKNPIIPNVL